MAPIGVAALTRLGLAVDDFPTRIADLLESVASRIRAMTVDRIAGWVKWVALIPVLLVLVALAGIFLAVGLFRILAEVIGSDIAAYAILGAVPFLAGLVLWLRRNPRLEDRTSGAAEEIGT